MSLPASCTWSWWSSYRGFFPTPRRGCAFQASPSRSELDSGVGLARREKKEENTDTRRTGHPGATALTIDAVQHRLALGGLGHVVVATSSGETGVGFLAALAGREVQLVCVTHHAGFREGDALDLLPEHEAALRTAGVPILITTHALSGVGRSISSEFGGATPVELVAHALRLFGQGMKVCVEIAVMAADAGLVPTDRDVVCVGGTGRGADTAVVLRPAHANRFFDLRVREILCKPVDI